MSGSYVVDASVAAKLYFVEIGSVQAELAIREANRIIAPDLLFLEMASIAAKKVRRSLCSFEQAADAVDTLGSLLDETIAASELASRAFGLAAADGFSAYDSAYLSLAELREFELLTADAPLVRLARKVGLGQFVRLLE